MVPSRPTDGRRGRWLRVATLPRQHGQAVEEGTAFIVPVHESFAVDVSAIVTAAAFTTTTFATGFVQSLVPLPTLLADAIRRSRVFLAAAAAATIVGLVTK